MIFEYFFIALALRDSPIQEFKKLGRHLVHIDFSIKTKRSVCLRLNVLQTVDTYQCHSTSLPSVSVHRQDTDLGWSSTVG